MRGAVEHHEAIDTQILVHGEADRWPPLVPARWPELAGIQRRPEKSDNDQRLHLYTLG